MTRTTLFLSLATAGAIYQFSKLPLGFEPDIKGLIDSVYWSGTALLVHWLMNPAAPN